MAKEAVGEVDLDAIVCLDDMEHAAQRVMDRQDFDYFAARLRSPSAGMCVVVSTSETSTMHRGQMVTRENAARFARSVDSVSAPGSVVLGDRGQ